MANIFRKKDAYIDRVNRSTFDLSFVNNLTMKFGAITPVCLLPASFGDSFQINARFNLQLLPTVFPIQTQLYVRLHFVYVRTRTLWEDWMAFFGGDETVTPPWIDPTAENTPQGHKQFNIADDLQTGTLADYLGVPTTITGTYGSEIKGLRRTPFYSANRVSPLGTLIFTHLGNVDASTGTINKIISKQGSPLTSILADKAPAVPNYYGCKTTINAIQYDFSGVQSTKTPVIRISLTSFPELKSFISTGRLGCIFSVDGSVATSCAKIDSSALKGDYLELSFNVDSAVSSFVFYLLIEYESSKDTVSDILTVSYAAPAGTYWYGIFDKFLNLFNNLPVSAIMSSSQWTKPESANCPFYTTDSKKLPSIPLSALPFRAYESYYNAFGRDIRNNPFIVDGKPEYNKYIPSTKGGSDTYKYQLHYANWEPDAYTTALQSPQAGVAPLVGITSLGEATFRDASGVEYHAQLETADDGDTVTGFQVKSSNAPTDVIHNLIGMATSGVSISDFRNVNSLQRFLEIRIRQTPRYKNLVKGLFDVNLDYDELMMPEFLGGISDTIPVYKVTQTTPVIIKIWSNCFLKFFELCRRVFTAALVAVKTRRQVGGL